MSKSVKASQLPLAHDEIAARARRIYDMEGRPEGKAMEHWLQAESQLIAERKASAGAVPAKAAAAPVAPAARGTAWPAQQQRN